MSRIQRLVRPAPQTLNWKAALPVLGLTAALMAGCAQQPVAPSATPSSHTNAVVQFASCARPQYPEQALRDKQTGTVKLGFLVDKDGAVRDARVDQSSGVASLDEAARSAIAKCTFTPSKDDGVAVQSWTPVQYVWALN